MRIVVAPTWELASALAPTVSIEAEYGANVLEGSRYTAAHHQPAGSPYAGDHVVEGGRPCPCVDPDIPELGEDDLVVFSHLDLDSIGGALRGLGKYRDLFEGEVFWQLASFVDVNGPHKLEASPAASWRPAVEMLYAYWAWSKTNRGPFFRTEVYDVTEYVLEAGEVLRKIFAGDPDLLAAGQEFASAEAALENRSFRGWHDNIILRRASGSAFVNHLYGHSGVYAEAVIALNDQGAVTVSLESPIAGVSCRDVVQFLWGPEAGGHDGIAGSPRGRKMVWGDVVKVADHLALKINDNRQS